MLDDTTLDKPYASKMKLVTYHWSGKHQRLVKGISLITLLWTDGAPSSPATPRVYDKPLGGPGTSTSGTCSRRLRSAASSPGACSPDSWYASLKNLKAAGKPRLALAGEAEGQPPRQPRREGKRQGEHRGDSPRGESRAPEGLRVRQGLPDSLQKGGAKHWATSDPGASRRRGGSPWRGRDGASRTGHRGIKQCCGAEKAQVRGARAQKAHILLALRSFVRLEAHRLRTGLSWYEAKTGITREAIRTYLANPAHILSPTA